MNQTDRAAAALDAPDAYSTSLDRAETAVGTAQPPQPASPPHHEHVRREEDLSATAVVWDERLREWRSHDEEDDLRDEAERLRDEESSAGTAVGPTPSTLAEGEKAPDNAPRQVAVGRGRSLSTAGTLDVKDGKEVIWLEWEKGDPDNPFNWSNRKKWTTCLISCYFTLLAAYAGTAFAMGNGSMMDEFDCSHTIATLGLSVFPLGFGLGPLFTAPLSEAFGRYPLYVVSSFVYLVFIIPIAYGQNIATVIVGRFIAGVAASTGSTLVGGTVADLFESHNRGLPMSIFSICAFAGTGLGPAISGYIELKKGWRWIEWLQMMLAGVLLGLVIFFTRETRGNVILSRRARKLRKAIGDERYQCRSDAERASMVVLMKVSMTRPLYLLGTEAIVFFFSLWVGFAWGSLYLLVEAVPLIFGNVYGFNIGQVGLAFYSVVFASFIGFGTNFIQERMYRSHVAKRGPEARLYASLVGGLVFPAGAFILAFSQGRGHWMGPIVGLTMGVYTIYLAVFSYLADCYTIMYNGLGYQWASFLAGCIALALAATPWALYFFGPTIRAKSNFAKELARMRGESK
ncbi:hypothetical protein Rhopal_005162-T1 [Rhodotorula paludigena]|uniref:Major facilitator superfamily (MFS) profile domain-containing protein n=1 Tax=Rhodotorula paludigena TaxID=86838 RepID=A0AAV5GRM5_9BASI|nr:hypothetical protein Rhopal_005162-T1 [Rhodotorula paludigena]